MGDEQIATPVGTFAASRWRFTALDSGWIGDLWVAGDIVVRYEGRFELTCLDPGASGPRPVARKAGTCTHINYTRRMKDFFRTELGKTLRVEESDEGALTVDILKEGVWKAAPRGMIGLRLSPDSRSLTAAEILALPL